MPAALALIPMGSFHSSQQPSPSLDLHELMGRNLGGPQLVVMGQEDQDGWKPSCFPLTTTAWGQACCPDVAVRDKGDLTRDPSRTQGPQTGTGLYVAAVLS